MNRGEFLKIMGLSTVALSTGRLVSACQDPAQSGTMSSGKWMNTSNGDWKYLGSKDITSLSRDRQYKFDVAVIGGGIAGISADVLDLARSAKISASSTLSGDVALLTDGYSRDEVDTIHHWESQGTTPTLILEWEGEQEISELHLKCDSSLHREIQIHPNKNKYIGRPEGMPLELMKSLKVEALINGGWREVTQIDNNLHRLIKVNFEGVATTSVRVKFEENYGAASIKIFEVRCYK